MNPSTLWPSMLTTATSNPLGIPGTGSASSLGDPPPVLTGTLVNAVPGAGTSSGASLTTKIAVPAIAVLLIIVGAWVLLNG